MKERELSFEDLKDKVDNIFLLINLASKRVGELASGAPKLVETECDTLLQIALEEIAQDKIKVGTRKKQPEEEEEK